MRDRTKKLPYFVDTVIEEIETEELCGAGTDKNGDPKYEVRSDNPKNISLWGDPDQSMEIDLLEEYIADLRQKGCNRVAIMFHTDHGEYIFTGVKREEVLDKETVKARKIKEIEEHISTLYNDIINQDDQINRINKQIDQKKQQLLELKSKIDTRS